MTGGDSHVNTVLGVGVPTQGHEEDSRSRSFPKHMRHYRYQRYKIMSLRVSAPALHSRDILIAWCVPVLNKHQASSVEATTNPSPSRWTSDWLHSGVSPPQIPSCTTPALCLPQFLHHPSPLPVQVARRLAQLDGQYCSWPCLTFSWWIHGEVPQILYPVPSRLGSVRFLCRM